MSNTSAQHLLELLNDTQGELDQVKAQVNELKNMMSETMGAVAIVTEMIARTMRADQRTQLFTDLRIFAGGAIKERAPFTASSLEWAADQVEKIRKEG